MNTTHLLHSVNHLSLKALKDIYHVKPLYEV
jgi:hypothetical protein